MLTVYPALESLTTNFAFQVANAGLLFELDRHGLLMVAEETGEEGWERLVLNTGGCQLQVCH
jgi:hypothetical protein